MQTSIRMDRDVPMAMRDGTVLRADIYRPEDNDRHPAILVRTPYNKLLSGNSDFLNFVDAAHAGYAVAIQDIRGRFASEGEWRQDAMFMREGVDGYDSVEWIAGQPWCDGNVGMAGGSYLAALQWVTAMENPPHLKAIAPWIGASSTLEEQSLTGGATALYMMVSWVPTMAVDVADRMEKSGRDVADMRLAIAHALSNPSEVYSYLPLKEVPLAQFEGIREMWGRRLNTAADRELAERARRKYDRVTVPCFHVSGWYDIFTWATFHNFGMMREQGGSDLAREGQHVLMGPWIHGGRLLAFWGGLHFGASAGVPAAQVSEQSLAFFDKYLRGMDIHIPAVRYFVMGRNRWQNADTWPLPQTRWQRFYLHSMGGANTAQGDGVLSPNEPDAEPNDMFVYNPLRPVPTVGGRFLPMAGLVPGPLDQSHIERRQDILCYTTAELEEDVEVTGPLEMHLFAATSARDTDFTAKLVDVYPDGRAYNIAEGIKRARGRESVFNPEPVNPGEIIEYTINLGDSSQLFRKGHRVRIDISSSNFPMYDRNMNTANPIGEDAEGVPAMQTIYHQRGYASYVDLPVIPTGTS
jgi:putative CocE/NonD family hydrolase